MSKYTRHQSVISRNSDQLESEDHWLKQFQTNLGKEAVQPYRVDQSLFHQINNIMNGKAKYPSVAAAVQEMQERSGLTAYLDKINKISENNGDESTTKTASKKEMDLTPIVVKKCPNIQSTIENCVRDSKGNVSVPALLDRVRSIHQSDVSDAKDWEDDKLILFISKLNLDAKKNNPHNFENYTNLGKREHSLDSEIDPSNTDAFHGLNPVKY